ncbi:signal recognition particle-docking protein FtsY [Oceanococcus atlanticus]|uniref:Signal recognition particle receptor FtsY n=2 Tax=Oceanococcus atlanticus TaxID=1317117 RepID=A0A1Y1SF07_9GAMM|nr:signal recognition particle-docking protein FtsY [Oceanococcus atlanticus]
MRAQINRGDSWLTYDLANLLPGEKIDEDALEDFEDLLIQADLGIEAASEVCEKLRGGINSGRIKRPDQLRKALHASLVELLSPSSIPLEIPEFIRPFVIMAVGVNGVGKTTTMGKIGARLKQQGLSVMFAAGDTYRAGAVAQLETWAEKVDIPIVGQGQNADPASVIFDAYSAAKARNVDVLIADTAGRLHTQGGLMEELRKIKRVMQKHDQFAPHELMIVVDATAGHNALKQALEFHEAVGLTGITLTKLDGTAKGGAIFAIAKRLALPIRFVGVGEQAEDLGVFDANEFVSALLGDTGD